MGGRMVQSTLIERVETEKEQIIDLLRNLVERESPSNQKDLVDEVGAFIRERLGANGCDCQVETRTEAGDIVWGEWDGGGTGSALVLCHIDTVWAAGSLARNPFRVEEGKVYGPGIFDMKSGVAAALKAVEYLHRGWIRPERKIRFLFTTDEEVTSAYSRELIGEFAKESDFVLVPEPPLPGGGVKTFRRGVGGYVLKVHGRAAHSGLDPERGVNAVQELAGHILDISSLSDQQKGTTVSVNVVRGGSVQNMIADYAEAVVDFRFRELEEGDRVESVMGGLAPRAPGIRLQLEGGIDRPPMIRSERTVTLFRAARDIAREIGIDLEEGESGGASDGNITGALGIPTLDGLGINGDGAHAWHEHVELSAVVPRIALFARLLERL